MTRALCAVFVVLICAMTTANAKPRHHKHHEMPRRAITESLGCLFDNDGHKICRGAISRTSESRRASAGYSPKGNQPNHQETLENSRKTYEEGIGTKVLGGRPAGCPHAYCGCEASQYVFGEKRRDLFLAANWLRRFPRTTPAPGMAAARRGHVFILISHVGGSDWLAHDGNSGGGKTREHVVSINRYTIVNPHASRVAMR